MTDEQKLLECLREVFQAASLPFSEGAWVNGPEAFNGDDAEDIIVEACRRVAIPAAEACRFPFDTYFLPETAFYATPWSLIIGIATFVLDLLAAGKRTTRGADSTAAPVPPGDRPPLTVRDFTALILRIKAEVENQAS